MFQMSLFDGSQPFKIDKPIRLIELFAGYGSQALSLKYLGVPFEHHVISEWAVKSIQAYKDMHFASDSTDYSMGMTDGELVDFLDGRISADYNKPMTRKQIEKHNGGEKWRRAVYNNMKATRNLGSITMARGGIYRLKKPTNIATYSPTHSPAKTFLRRERARGWRKGVERVADCCGRWSDC